MGRKAGVLAGWLAEVNLSANLPFHPLKSLYMTSTASTHEKAEKERRQESVQKD